jgi:hypothetical protein
MKPVAGDIMCVLVIAALCLFASLPRYSSNLDLGDEGLLAYGAERVMEGQVPNRDFVSLQPPLSFYVAATTFRLFGTSLISLRMLGVAIYVLMPILLYALARTLNGRWLSLAAALPGMVLGISFAHFVPVAVWQGVIVCMAATLLLLLATDRPGRWQYLAFPAGLFTGSAMFLRQDQGFYMLVSLAVYLIALKLAQRQDLAPRNLKLPVMLWLGGIAAVVIPLGVYWVCVGAVSEMFRQLVLFPLTTYSKTSALPFPSLRSGFTHGSEVSVLLYYLAPVIVIPGAVALAWLARKRFGSREAKYTLLLAWTALFYCQVLVRTDMDHLLITLPPLFLLLVTAFGTAWHWLNSTLAARTPPTQWLLKGFVGFLAVGLAAGFLAVSKPKFLPPPLDQDSTIAVERAGVRKMGAANIKKFVERVEQFAPKDRSILCLPYEPMFYFLCQRRNPTHWNYLWPGDQTAADHELLISQARKDPPAVIVLTRESDMVRYAPAILDYVHSEYKLAANAGGMFSIYVPKASNP